MSVIVNTREPQVCLIETGPRALTSLDRDQSGGMKTYCSPAGKYDPQQGELPSDFWRNVEFKNGTGPGGGRYAQREFFTRHSPRADSDLQLAVTGCIRSEKVDRLNPDDAGGQYDSSGGAGGLGNPQGSICLNYNHYVELVEPRGPRACIRCCDDPSDCPLDKDTQGCPSVIPGNYFDCA